MRNKIVILLLASLLKTMSIYAIDTKVTDQINQTYNQRLDPTQTTWPADSLTRAGTALQIYNSHKAELQRPENHDWHAKVVQLIIFYQQLIQLDSSGGLNPDNLKKLNNQIKTFKRGAGLEDFVNERPMISSVQSIILIMQEAIPGLSIANDTVAIHNCFHYLMILFSAFEPSVCTERDIVFWMRKIVALKNDSTELLKQFGYWIQANQDDNWKDIFYGQQPHIGSESITYRSPLDNLDAARNRFIKIQQDLQDILGAAPAPVTTPTPTPAPAPVTITVTPAPAPAPTIVTPTPVTTVAPTPTPAPYVPQPQPIYRPTPAPVPTVTPPALPTRTPPVTPAPAPTQVTITVTPTPTPTPAPTRTPVVTPTPAPVTVTVTPTPVPTPGTMRSMQDLSDRLMQLQMQLQMLKASMPS